MTLWVWVWAPLAAEGVGALLLLMVVRYVLQHCGEAWCSCRRPGPQAQPQPQA